MPSATLDTLDDATCGVRILHPEAVAAARAALPATATLDSASVMLKAFADPTRLRILSALAASDLCVCDIAAVLGLSESAVSHQLRVLRTSQLVTYRKQGRIATYRLLDQHVRDLLMTALEHARHQVP